MSMGYIYQVSTKEVVEEYDYIRPDEFYDNETVQAWSDYIYDEDRVEETAFEAFASLVDDDRYKEVVTINRESQTITLHPGFKEVWFARKFKKFQEEVRDVNLEKFMDDYFEYGIRRLLGASFDEFIYETEVGYPVKLDSYFRSLKLDEPITYYFGGLVAFHY